MKRIHLPVLLCALLALPALVHGAEGEGGQERSRQQERSQLATPEERAAYQDRMKSLATQEERDALRQEHSELLKSRAREHGLPEPQAPQGRLGSGQDGSGGGNGKTGGGGRGGMGRGR